MCWLRILFSLRTVANLLASIAGLLELLKDHPEYGEQAVKLLKALSAFVVPPAGGAPNN